VEGYKRFASTGEGEFLGKTLTCSALHKDGPEFPIELSVSALRIGRGWHSLGIARDIKDRVLAENKLRDATLQMRRMIDSSLDPIVTINPNGKITDANEAMARLSGVPREMIIGSDYFNYALEPEKAQAGFWEAITKGVVTNFPLIVRHTSGKLTDMLFSATVYHDNKGDLAGVFVVGRDITELKQVETELRNREAELKDAQRVAQVGSWEWAPETNTFKWSDELYRIFARDPNIPAPNLEEHDRIIAPHNFVQWKTAFSLLQHTGAPYEIDLEIVRGDGSAGWISARGHAERDASGQIIRLHGTAQDITPRKLADQNIERLHQELREKVEVLRRNEQNMKAIAKLSDILQACHTRTEAYPIISATAKSLFRDASGALSIIMEGSQELATVALWGDDRTMLPAFSFDDCWALRTGQLYEVGGSGANAPCRHFRASPHGPYVCLPLSVYGGTTGLLHVSVSPSAAIDDEMRRLILSFGDVIKLSLSNLRLRETLSEQAMRDHLTTLFNRHYLAETLPREIRRAQRSKSPLVVAMLDIDHFKALNDTHGHDAGDAILKEVGRILRCSLRAGDMACRYGGEEFLLILPECDLENALRRVEGICLEIKGTAVEFQGQPLPKVTMSAGLAPLDEELSSDETLIGAADEALYAAKQNGRDRIEIFSAKRRLRNLNQFAESAQGRTSAL